MSTNESLENPITEDNSDSMTDAFCAVALIAIAVLSVVYWVTNQ